MLESEYRELDKTHIYSTLLKTIYQKSGMHVDTKEVKSDSMKFGSLAHMYILENERFREEVIVQPEFYPISKEMKDKYDSNMDNYSRTKECQEQKKKFEDSISGRSVVSQSDLDRVSNMLSSIKLANIFLHDEYLTGGKAEHTIVIDNFRIGDKFYPVKVRIDYFVEGGVITIVDLKTTQNASINSFRYDIKKYGYDIQASFYVDVVRQAFPGIPVDFIWLAVETLPPYAPAWYRLSEDTYKEGKQKYTSVMDEALQLLRGGIKKGYDASYEIALI